MVFTPKGWEFSAQGNAPGSVREMTSTLKGCDKACRRPSACGVVVVSAYPGRRFALPRAELCEPCGLKLPCPLLW